jgi:leader peptidase (prepilin peptidase)/N-methyltransferase
MAKLAVPHRWRLRRFLLAAVYGAALLISGRATRKHQTQFGPFMITGALLVILAGT